MERSEPSLVPEWLRSNGGSLNGSGGGGGGGGGSSHQFASSQADGPVLALPRRNGSSKTIGNTDSLHSPLLDRSNSSNSRRSSNGNGFGRHDKNSYTRSYSSYSRNHRDNDRDRSSIADNWDSEYSDPLRSMINGRGDDPLRRSQSSISRRQGDAPLQRFPSDIRNGVHRNHDNGNGNHSSSGNVSGVQKVSFEQDFPVLGSEDRPRTPDVVRVSSPGLSRAIQNLSGSETWTSALVDVPSATTTSSSTSVSLPLSTSSGLKMVEALVQAPAQTHNASQSSVQLQKDEFAIAQSKKLIPVTPLVPKTLIRSSSDKLKPKTAMRPNETIIAPKNGAHHLSPLQLGSQPVRGVSVRGDGPKSPSSGKLLLLKAGRENGVSSGLKDLQSPTTVTINNRVANGHSAGNPSVASVPSKNLHNPKILPGERKTSGTGVDKRTSRSNFFKLMREKSLNNASGPIDSGASTSSDVVDKSVQEAKELVGVQATPADSGSELKCSAEPCTAADSFSPSKEIDNEEERAFLLSLGWEDHAESDEEGLTEEEMYACYLDVMKQCPTSRLCRVLQAKIFPHLGCSSTESKTPASQTEA